MIVVDTSALIEMLMLGPQADACRHAIEGTKAVYMCAGTMTETVIVGTAKGLDAEVPSIRTKFEVEIVALSAERSVAAGEAYRNWGKGYHPARLNFGDCFASALAKERGCPLLFVGEDFARTDAISSLG